MKLRLVSESRAAAVRDFRFAVGETVRDNKVRNVTKPWSQFVRELSTTARTAESFAQYMAMPREQQDVIKDIGYYVTGHFSTGTRKKDALSERDVISLDIDHAASDWWDRVQAIYAPHEFVIHTTHKHSPDKPRLRLLFPTARPVSVTEYEPVARAIAAKWNMDIFDDTTFQWARVMHLPSTSRDGEYCFHHNPGAFLDPDRILDRSYIDWQDMVEWPVSKRVREPLRPRVAKATDPLLKDGVIGAFCQAYDIHSAIETFLSDVYLPGSCNGRYTYARASASNGAVVYDDGRFLYSHHESDPAGQKSVNAFDLVRLHLFGNLDADSQRDAGHASPSFREMLDFARKDRAVAEILSQRTARELDGFDDDAQEALASVRADVLAELQAHRADTLFLPGDYLPAPAAADRIFSVMGAARELFRRGEEIVELGADGFLKAVTATELRSRLNAHGRIVRAFGVSDHGKLVSKPKACSADHAQVLCATREKSRLPPIALIVRAPVLVDVGGELVSTPPGYNEHGGGILVHGERAVASVPLAEAVRTLSALLHDFKFASDGDRARALVSLVAPALRMARLLPGNALVTTIEADQSQSGKGFYLAVLRAIYGEPVYTVVRRAGGVGSLDESLGAALLSGAPFVSFDNLRGALDSQALESAITAGSDAVRVRVPHRGEVGIDIRSVCFQLTSNGVEGTTDLANRVLVIRLRKQEPGYTFREFSEGNLLAHVEANQADYLGAVHSIVREWARRGRQRLPSRHSFREYTGALDWIGQHIFGTVALLTDHESVTQRLADPARSWLRQIGLEVLRVRGNRCELRAADIFGIGDDAGIALPGSRRDELNEEVGAKSVGRLMQRCFKGEDSVMVDNVQVLREEKPEWDSDYRGDRAIKRYTFIDATAAGECGTVTVDASGL